MPGPNGLITIALDFDGSLVEDHVRPPVWRRGAKEFILGGARAGLKMYIHSCRCTLVGYDEAPGDVPEYWRSGRLPEPVEYSWGLLEELRGFLEMEGVWPLVELWTGPGKPICDVYADDRSERPDWLVLAGELGVVLEHEAGRPQAMGGPVVVGPAPGVADGGGAQPGPVVGAHDAPAGT